MWISVGWSALGCREGLPERGTCVESDDCLDGEFCLFDADLATTYCSRRCSDDSMCDRSQRCSFDADAVPGELSGFCTDLLRTCSDVELCDGLDNNCDGTVDEEGCELIVRCLENSSCGAFVCGAPSGQPDTVCVPPLEDGLVNDYQPCQSGDQCENGVCEAGFCAPFCRPQAGADDIDPCPDNRICARAFGDLSAPKHNVCQLPCESQGACGEGEGCVWRDVFQGGDQHASVCSTLDSERLPLGAQCPNNIPDDGDNMCQFGLCFDRVCTRVCGGPGSSCADVGPDFVCESTVLLYGSLEFLQNVCVRAP